MPRYRFQWAIWLRGSKLGHGHAKSANDCALAAAATLKVCRTPEGTVAQLHVAEKDDWSDAKITSLTA